MQAFICITSRLLIFLLLLPLLLLMVRGDTPIYHQNWLLEWPTFLLYGLIGILLPL